MGQIGDEKNRQQKKKTKALLLFDNRYAEEGKSKPEYEVQVSRKETGIESAQQSEGGHQGIRIFDVRFHEPENPDIQQEARHQHIDFSCDERMNEEGERAYEQCRAFGGIYLYRAYEFRKSGLPAINSLKTKPS